MASSQNSSASFRLRYIAQPALTQRHPPENSTNLSDAAICTMPGEPFGTNPFAMIASNCPLAFFRRDQKQPYPSAGAVVVHLPATIVEPTSNVPSPPSTRESGTTRA